MAAAASPKTRRLNKKLKRGYTDLEVYAHLHPVKKDYLQENLDVVFVQCCSDGLARATCQLRRDIVHHFAIPMTEPLHIVFPSTLTSTLSPSSEVYSLPKRCNLGLVNIVDKPSAEVSVTAGRIL